MLTVDSEDPSNQKHAQTGLVGAHVLASLAYSSLASATLTERNSFVWGERYTFKILYVPLIPSRT